jgi:quinone-modifying oxidoreductase subunit QmoC
MGNASFVEPNLDFIRSLSEFGASDLKKCFQCATCSVACPISPENRPFPRKEMIAASWGLKDRLVGNADIWLCHNCGDCTSLCPRGAKPGDVLSAIRNISVLEYSKPKIIGSLVNNPSKLPFLLLIPVFIFIVLGIILKMFGVNWLKFNPSGEDLWQADFISNYLVDLIMVPTLLISLCSFGLSLKNFLFDIHKNALSEGKTNKDKLIFLDFLKAFFNVIPVILKHKRFGECGDNGNRLTPHMMVLFAFIGLFIVTQCFFIAEWVFHIEGPYNQINPIKWLGNVSGVALVIGSLILLKNRLDKKDQKSGYFDWFLLGLVLSLGLSGMFTEMLRLGSAYKLSAIFYFIHLISIWCFFAYLPFSKLAHIFYRTLAMTYKEYSNRK